MVDSLLVKLAMRCNIACTYCYWFRDETVYDAPACLTDDASRALLRKLGNHVSRYPLPRFSVMFHGGEPLLYGKLRFARLCAALREVVESRGSELVLSVQTNGVLVDPEWVEILRRFDVAVGISIDGPQVVHDRRRVDFGGRGTYERVRAGVRLLQSGGVRLGFLAVCDPGVDPRSLVEHFVDDIGTDDFDVLVPDATHEDDPSSIADYYIRLFDLWLDEYAAQGVRIRFVDSVLLGLLGRSSASQSIGYGPITTVTVLTDGSLEALDVCRVAGSKATRSRINVGTHEIQDATTDPVWREIHRASLELATDCRTCPFEQACGGGHIASRWSTARRYDNPSVYCSDYKAILGHIWERIAPTLFVELPEHERELQTVNGGIR